MFNHCQRVAMNNNSTHIFQGRLVPSFSFEMLNENLHTHTHTQISGFEDSGTRGRNRSSHTLSLLALVVLVSGLAAECPCQGSVHVHGRFSALFDLGV